MIRRGVRRAERVVVHVVSSYWFAGATVATGCCTGW